MKYTLRFTIFALLVLQAMWVQAQENDTYWDSLEHAVLQAPPDTNTVIYLNKLFDYYSSSGHKQAMPYVQRAWHLADSLSFRRGLALSTLNLAMAQDMQGNYYEALRNYHKALKLAQELNNEDYRSRCLLSLGYFYGTQGNYDKAIECTKESALLEEKLFGLDAAAYAWNNLGYYHIKKQQYDSAQFYTLKAYEIFKAEKDSSGLGDVYFNLSNIAWEADNNASKALNYSLKAEQMYESGQNNEIEAITECHAQIGFLYTKLQNFSKAGAYLEKALSEAKKNNFRYIIQNCYKHKGEMYSAIGDYKMAYECLKNYNLLHDSLYNQQNSVTLKQIQTEYELETQEAKVALLNKDKIIRLEELERQLLIRNGFIVMVLMLMALAAVLFRNNQQKKKSNTLLLMQKNEIEEKSKAIARKNLMLQEQKRAMLLQSRSLHEANQQIVRQKETIEQKNKDTTASLNYARSIQYAMLPQAEQISKRMPDAFVWLQPRDIVSGDFFWYHEQDEKLFIAAVDCTGHGVPGAFMSLIGDSYLSQIVRIEGQHEPDQVLSLLGKHVSQVLKQETSENQDGMEMSFCVIDLDKKELHFAGARNNLYYVQNERLFKIKGNRAHIGGRKGVAEPSFTKHTVQFNKPTKFYLYSDGVRDQFGGKQDKKFGEKQLNELLLEVHHLPMSKQRMLIKSRLEGWMKGYEQVDDILILGWSLP